MLVHYLKFGCHPSLLSGIFHSDESIKLKSCPKPDSTSLPFQIDASLAAAGCITEMLMQSHRYSGSFHERIFEINLLPALPVAWKAGCISGLRARGGFTVDIEWESHVLKRAHVSGNGIADIKYNNINKRIVVNPGKKTVLDEKLNLIT